MARLREQHEGEDPMFLVAKETEIADRYQWEDEVLFYTEEDFYHATFILAFHRICRANIKNGTLHPRETCKYARAEIVPLQKSIIK